MLPIFITVHYKSSQTFSQLQPNQKVLLSNPIKGKLSPRWTGPWTVLCMKSPTTVQLKMGAVSHMVHINQVHPLMLEEDKDHQASPNWVPPLFIYKEILQQPDQMSTSDENAADSSTSEGPSELAYLPGVAGLSMQLNATGCPIDKLRGEVCNIPD